MPDLTQPAFSIITPTARRPLLLERNINSVKNQTYTDYEHIIIDDVTDKETDDLIKRISDKKIIFLQHETPRGAAGGYNSGIKIAKGRFILFLDDDDEYLPCFLEKMYERFSACNDNVGFIWTGISRILDTDEGEKLLFSRIWPDRFPTREEGLVNATSIGNGFGVCVRKSCIDSIGLYDETLMIGEDTDFLFRLVKQYDFETIPEVLVKIHQHGPSQLTDKKNYLVRLELREKILERYLDLLYEYPNLYYIHYKVVADFCYILKLKKKGRRTMKSIIKNTPFRLLNFIDFFFYEFSGKDMLSFYRDSRLKRFIHFVKGQ
jgi:glycosyltransferase involved in cell wall biosynthesis